MDKEHVVYKHNKFLFGHERNDILSFEARGMGLEELILSKSGAIYTTRSYLHA